MSRILYTSPPKFPLYKELPFQITAVRNQTYLTTITTAISTMTANAALQNITITFPANFNVSGDTVFITTVLDPAVDYQGYAPFGVNSWLPFGANNQMQLQCYNTHNVDVNFRVSVIKF